MTIGFHWFRPDRVIRTGVIEPTYMSVSPVAAAQRAMAQATSAVSTSASSAPVTGGLGGYPVPAAGPQVSIVAPIDSKGAAVVAAAQRGDMSQLILAQNRAYATGTVWDQIRARQRVAGMSVARNALPKAIK